jgi:hypothetical protein
MTIRDNEQLNVYVQVVTGERRYWTEPMPGINEVIIELGICSEWSEAGRSCDEVLYEFLNAVCKSRDYLEEYFKDYKVTRSKKEGISKAAIQGSLLGCQHVVDLLDEVGYSCPENSDEPFGTTWE